MTTIAAACAGPAPATARAAPSPLALSCLGCHQPAVDAPEMPALARLGAARIEAALKAARDQPRPEAIMPRFVARMSDAQLHALAVELSAGMATR